MIRKLAHVTSLTHCLSKWVLRNRRKKDMRMRIPSQKFHRSFIMFINSLGAFLLVLIRNANKLVETVFPHEIRKICYRSTIHFRFTENSCIELCACIIKILGNCSIQVNKNQNCCHAVTYIING